MQSSVFEPMDMAVAEAVLKEAKEILDQLGLPFFLRHGTCLGAVRDQAFIGWDDDLDIGSVIGFHGLTEPLVLQAAELFRERGFEVEVIDSELHMSVDMHKSGTQLDWTCYRIIDDYIYQWPAVQIPARLHENLKEIDFLGERFMVPNPPEEYLRLKYGPDWKIPKRAGYENDVLDLMPDAVPPSLVEKLVRWARSRLPGGRRGRLKVLDQRGMPVHGAEVVVAATTLQAGLVRSTTDKNGYVGLGLPTDGKYVLAIRYEDHEEILYLEELAARVDYVYRPDPEISSGRAYVLAPKEAS
ncbi:MAG: LicD family protein [Chloroflexi bacterium]|nr:LicD family protein [Chloroflexota bacterium]